MKKLISLILSVLCLFFGFLATSCDKDKLKAYDPVPELKGNTVYNGQNFSISKGYYIDGQSVRLFGKSPTHYLNFLFVTDGTPVFSRNGEISNIKDGEIMLMASFFSAGSSKLGTGTFEYSDMLKFRNSTEKEVEAAYNNKSFFYNPVAIVDTDSDGNWEEENEVLVTGGTIKVRGNFPDITTEFNLTTKSGKALKGNFRGNFNKVVLNSEEVINHSS